MSNTPVRVVVRKEKATGRNLLFFKNSNSRGNWIECFDPCEGHTDVSREFMQRACSPVPVDDFGAVALAKQWAALGGENTPVLIARRL